MSVVTYKDDPQEILSETGFGQGAIGELGFWGDSYAGDGMGGGTTHLPMINIPTSPVLSLVDFTHAHLSYHMATPMNALGSSNASIFVGGNIYDEMQGQRGRSIVTSTSTAYDNAWLLNDALFDRYFLSGLAAPFTYTSSYNPSGTLDDTIDLFFGGNYLEAEASPMLRPYIPRSKSEADVIEELSSTTAGGEGYKKLAAYSLLDGAFNVNSTSVKAWASLLRSNKGLEVYDPQNGEVVSMTSETPYPGSSSPMYTPEADELWTGVKGLSDDEITSLATEIVALVKERGPFMSLSDFINRQMGENEGVIQAAIEAAGLNAELSGLGEDFATEYTASDMSIFVRNPDAGSDYSATNIAHDLTQAKVLLPIAPKLRPRSDTFTIRSYGESASGEEAYCEVVVQRLPDYCDTANEPWDESKTVGSASSPESFPRESPEEIFASGSSNLTELNSKLGRKFTIVSFRWLNKDEI